MSNARARLGVILSSFLALACPIAAVAQNYQISTPEPWRGTLQEPDACREKLDKKEPFQVRCVHALIGNIRNDKPFSPGLWEGRPDDDWMKLKPYWLTPKTMVFFGSACDSGVSEFMAKGGAKQGAGIAAREKLNAFRERIRAKFTVLDWQERGFAEECVRLDDGKVIERVAGPAPHQDQPAEPVRAPERAAREPESERSAALAAAAASEAARRARTLIFRIRSADRFAVQVSFYSQNRNNAWPGGTQAYNLKDSAFHEFPLNCNPGEKICMGAWRTGNANKYWGVGAGGKHRCSQCCAICGGEFTTTLRDGGASSGGAVSSGGGGSGAAAAGAVLGIAAGIAAGATRNTRPAGTTYRQAPTPRGVDRRPSGISR